MQEGFVLLKLEEQVHAFFARLMEFELAPLIEDPPFAGANWVWEFYIVPTIRRDNPHINIHIHEFEIPLNATTIDQVPKVSNAEYEAKLREMDLGWLMDNLVDPGRQGRVY